MTSRERVLAAITHREPDRVPHNLRPAPAHVERLRRETGATDFAEHFGHDIRYVGVVLPPPPPGTPADRWTPDPSPEEIARVREQTRGLQARGLAVCGAYACGVFEQAKHWLGDAETLLAPYEDPRGLRALLDRIAEWKGAVYGAYAAAGTDIVWIGDDLGAQRSLVMSPAHYREWYKPLHRRIVEHIRGLHPGARIAFHCCGHVTPLIRDLIEVGVDVLEAVQAEAMDIAFLKREFGRDIAFWGGVGTQSVFEQKTREGVLEGVRRTLATMAPGGGYIAAPCHTLTDDVPWENVVTYHEAVRDYEA